MCVGDTLDIRIVSCRDAAPALWGIAAALPASLEHLRVADGHDGTGDNAEGDADKRVL